ncbi:sugar phosphate nucleotidyltransferase [Bacillota bacterium Meth-B3]
MKAVIMAGGEGTRLRPLTCATPKPMVPVLDRPVMLYALELLKRHGVKQAAVTLMYLPERVTEYFGDGAEFGVGLQYYTEKTPLGTAGSVKQATGFLDETFAVLSGDGLTDCDLTAALNFHRERGALATLVLKKVKSPLEYGVVCTSNDARVQRFVEKPGWGEVCSDAVNTGIYILEPQVLEMIPAGKAFDFGRELFPQMVEGGLPVYGYPMEGYWCDIGDASAYLRAHIDLLDGRMKLTFPLKPGAVNRQRGALIDKSAVLEAPCFIAGGARVEAGARIGPYTVLAAGSRVGEEAGVKRSVLGRGAVAHARAQLRGAVLLSGAQAGENACAFEESVLGEGAQLGEGATLMPGVRVWPHKQVEDGERVDANVVWGGAPARRFQNGAFPLNSPAQAVRDAQAFAEALGFKEAVVARDASVEAMACQRAAVAGLMAQGVQVIDIGAATLPATRYARAQLNAGGALHVGRCALTPMGAQGAQLTRDEARKLMGALMREDYAQPFSGVTRPPLSMTGVDMLYVRHVASWSGAKFAPGNALRTAVCSRHEQLLSLCERAFHAAGCLVRAEWEHELMELSPGEVGIWLDDTGERSAFAGSAGALTEAERTLMLCWAALEGGVKELVLPRGATRAAEELAAGYGAGVYWTPSDRSAWQRALIERDPDQFMLHFDGIASALKLVGALNRKGLTLEGARRLLPRVHRHSFAVSVERRDKGRLLQKLKEALPDADASDGLTIERERGWAWISPAGDGRECLVLAESRDAEFARELCDFCSGEVERILKGK